MKNQNKRTLGSTMRSRQKGLCNCGLVQLRFESSPIGREKRNPSFLIVGLLVALTGILSTGKVYSQGNANNPKIEVVLVTIRPTGFEPQSISRPQGKFVLVVENRSGVEEVHLKLDRVTGNHMTDVKVDRKQHGDWHNLFDLSPGDYILTEANHSIWICKITITPN